MAASWQKYLSVDKLTVVQLPESPFTNQRTVASTDFYARVKDSSRPNFLLTLFYVLMKFVENPIVLDTTTLCWMLSYLNFTSLFSFGALRFFFKTLWYPIAAFYTWHGVTLVSSTCLIISVQIVGFCIRYLPSVYVVFVLRFQYARTFPLATRFCRRTTYQQ